MEIENKAMKIKTLAVIVLMTLPATSCEDNFLLFVDCSECFATDPSETVVTIKLQYSPRPGSSNSYLNIYSGPDTDAPLIRSFQPQWGRDITVTLAVNRTYTFEMLYNSEDKSYRSVTARRLTVKKTENLCDDPCYYVPNRTIDLRLKYQ